MTTKDCTISEIDRLTAQLLNSYVDRASSEMKAAKTSMENARLMLVIAQRSIDVATSDLDSFGKSLAEKYDFDMNYDSVDWMTGKITRCEAGEEEGDNPYDENDL